MDYFGKGELKAIGYINEFVKYNLLILSDNTTRIQSIY